MTVYTSHLFARPTLAEGVGRIVDFKGVLSSYNTSPTPELADQEAVDRDFGAVIAELRAAVTRLRNTD